MKIMKKLFYMISAVAVMASSASCNKIEQENTPAADGTTTLTVSATVPQTKTYWSGGNVKWVTNDVVKVFASDGTSVMSQPTTAASSTYDFTVSGWTVGKTPLYAVFNGRNESPEYDQVALDGENITLILRNEQMAYHIKSFDKDVNIAVGELTDNGSGVYSTTMKNVCGLLKFSIGKLTDVTEVVIKDKNGKSMTGTVKVKMVDGIPVVQEVVEGTESSEVSFVVGKNVGGEDRYFPAEDFYVCVLPGTYLPEITITSASSADPIVLTAKSEITVKRNEWIDFGAIDSAVPGSEEDDPVTPEPAESLTISIDFSSTEFTPAMPSSANKTSQTYAFESEGITYNIEIGSPKQGYFKSSNYLRLVHSVSVEWGSDAGYIKLPAVDGFALTGFEITKAHGSGTKNYKVFATSDFSGDSLTSFGLSSTAGPTNIDLSGKTSAGVGYYLATITNNAQFSKLVLTYTKVN